MHKIWCWWNNQPESSIWRSLLIKWALIFYLKSLLLFKVLLALHQCQVNLGSSSAAVPKSIRSAQKQQKAQNSKTEVKSKSPKASSRQQANLSSSFVSQENSTQKISILKKKNSSWLKICLFRFFVVSKLLELTLWMTTFDTKTWRLRHSCILSRAFFKLFIWVCGHWVLSFFLPRRTGKKHFGIEPRSSY